MSSLAPTLQAFFTDHLIRQRHASAHTIGAYRDTARLLLRFAEQRAGTPPSRLEISDLDAPLIGAFLDHLEQDRHNSARTRNARLAAIHSLFRFAALRHPEDAAVIQRVLAIPAKRFEQTLITYLTEVETEALLAAPDHATWTGRRDHALLTLAIHTGLRVSELTALTPPRPPAATRRARPLRRQRPQTADHPARLDRRRRPADLARRTRRPTRRRALPNPPRHPPQQRRHRTTPGPPRRDRHPGLPCPHLT